MLGKVEKAIRAAVADATNRDNTQKLMNEATRLVKVRTKLGFGVPEPGAQRERLKPLSDSYIEQRANKARYFTKNDKVFRIPIPGGPSRHPDLSETTTPTKSNLTFTGEMLDSLRGFVTGPGKGVVKPTGARTDGSGLTNQQVANFVSEQGRPFLNLSNNEILQLKQKFVDDLLKRINRKLT